ncbi:hypothetical protein CR327_005217, partial [Escherichia coli]|nr:hypothetical protein [Escherichia coli]
VFVGLYAYGNEKHEEHIQNGCINKFQQNIKLPVADKTEQKTEVLVFWNTVEAIARSTMLEFNNINHSGRDTHQSSHREGFSILLTLLQEQGEYPQPTSNDTEQ